MMSVQFPESGFARTSKPYANLSSNHVSPSRCTAWAFMIQYAVTGEAPAIFPAVSTRASYCTMFAFLERAMKNSGRLFA